MRAIVVRLVELSADELARLDEASAIELGFPHDFAGRGLCFGDTYELVDDHRHTGTLEGLEPLPA